MDLKLKICHPFGGLREGFSEAKRPTRMGEA